MGKWLDRNGEAIYGTRAFIRSKKDESVNPETNKTLYFTRKGNVLYMITTEWPEKDIILTGIKSRGNPDVNLLGSDEKVKSNTSGNVLTISLPRLNPGDCQPAYVFKIQGVL